MIFHTSITKPQKIIISLVSSLILIVGVFDQFSTSSHFIPNDDIAKLSLFFSIIAGYGVVLTGYRLAKYGKWAVSPRLKARLSPLFQHILYLVCIAPLISVLIYHTMGNIIPYLYTHYFGNQTEKQILVTAAITHNSKAKCRYEIRSKTFNYFFFDYCLTAQQYNQFPSHQEIMVKFIVRQSRFGITLESFQGILPESRNQP